jgi:glycosyltransferase involved in cell wall biosynthesis
MVKNALHSIKNLDYDNWELFIIDDGSFKPIEPIANEILKDYKNKFSVFQTGHYDVVHKWANQSMIGYYMNQYIASHKSDVVIVVCDDDALVSDYLTKLNEFYNNNPEELWSYCHVVEYNPYLEQANLATLNKAPPSTYWHNRFNGATLEKASCVLDSSQVTFRTQVFREGIHWHYPRTGLLDAVIFNDMVVKYHKPIKYANCVGQYKAVFPDQMGKRSQTGECALYPRDLENYV